MTRWITACVGAWAICVAGFLAIWLFGLCVHCLTTPGCVSRIDMRSLLAAVNYKSVATKGTLSAIALVGIVWLRRRSQ